MSGDPYKYFRVEARELLDVLAREVLALEKGPASGDTLARLLRAAHTLKGAARVVKATRIAEQAHQLEDLFAAVRDRQTEPTRGHVDQVLRHVDEIALLLSALETGGAPAAPRAEPQDRHETIRVVRLESKDVGVVVRAAGEAQTQVRELERRLEDIHRIARLLELASIQVAQRRDQARATLDDVRGQVRTLQREALSTVERLQREMQGLGDAAARLQLVPVETLFAFLERAARDAAATVGKSIRFTASGGDVRVDPEVLATIQGALLQLVRNAVAHGIEPAPVRRGAGKTPEGSIAVTVSRRGRAIAFTCVDDGAGIDLDAVRRALAARGAASGQLPTDDQALLQLLLKGGITTSPTVSAVAGRGVGLDIVRDALERLRGHASVQTQRGQGTTIALLIPASVAAIDALLVESDGVVAAIPLDAISRTQRVARSEIIEAGDGQALFSGGESLPVRALGTLLKPNDSRAQLAPAAANACVVRSDDRALALMVDRVLGIANVIAEPVPALAPAAAVVAGVSLDAAAAPRLVLDPASLVTAADAAPRPAATEPPRRSILVVDDSLTTRMLEQSILESAGYGVSVAASAEEGLQKARGGGHALFLVDVEMPGMDGFEFIEQVRADPVLRDTPAILVTSRASAEDRQRGRAVGAQGYIVKGDFDQSVLLARIRTLVQ